MKVLAVQQFGRLLPFPTPCTTFVDVVGVDAILGLQWTVLLCSAVEKETVL